MSDTAWLAAIERNLVAARGFVDAIEAHEDEEELFGECLTCKASKLDALAEIDEALKKLRFLQRPGRYQPGTTRYRPPLSPPGKEQP